MKQHIAYTGKLDGISYTYCDSIPEGFEIIKEEIFYTPDEDMVFIKDGEFYDIVLIKDGVDITDYTEVKDPRTQE